MLSGNIAASSIKGKKFERNRGEPTCSVGIYAVTCSQVTRLAVRLSVRLSVRAFELVSHTSQDRF